MPEIPDKIADAGFSSGEMAEWLKALVLKVLDEPTKPYISRVSPMFDIGVFFMEGNSDGRNIAKTALGE